MRACYGPVDADNLFVCHNLGRHHDYSRLAYGTLSESRKPSREARVDHCICYVCVCHNIVNGSSSTPSKTNIYSSDGEHENVSVKYVHSIGVAIGGRCGQCPQESKIDRTPKTESNRETELDDICGH